MEPTEDKVASISIQELRAILLERHNRIKQERRAVLNTLIGLSGGAIVLSMSLLKDIAPKRMFIDFVIAAWSSFAVAIICGLGTMVVMTTKSIRYQSRLEHELDEGRIVVESEKTRRLELYAGRTYYTPWTVFLLGELPTGFFFLLGTVFLGMFAVFNLLRS